MPTGPPCSSNRRFGSCRAWLSNNIFLLATASCVVIAVPLGLWIRSMEPSQEVVMLISYPGELFMRVLKLMILPFVISCLIIGTATLDVKQNGRMAVRTMVYFVTTSMLNVALGLVLATALEPGRPVSALDRPPPPLPPPSTLLDGFLDMGRNLVPDNLFQAAFEQTFTEYVMVAGEGNNTESDQSPTRILVPKRQLQYRSGTNTLGIIFFFLIFGSVLGTLGPQKDSVINFFKVVYEVLIKMLSGAIWFTPLGVGSVICGKMITIDELSSTLTQLSWFVITMAIGVLLYQLIFLQLIYFVFLRKNPFQYYVQFGPSIVTAFATASKSAAMPLTFRIMEERVRVDRRVAQFVLPIGTINMDGTALFLAVSLVFIAQMNAIPLGLGHLLTIALSCTVASMSSATVPSAALVLVLMLCATINAPTEDVSLLFAVDWFVDRMRTTNNLLGDCYACAVIEKLSSKELNKAPKVNGYEANCIRLTNGVCSEGSDCDQTPLP